MPLYELYCEKCGHAEEQVLKLDEDMPVCDKCGQTMRKAMSAPAFHLKGNNWYKDHYGLKKTGKKGGNKDGA